MEIKELFNILEKLAPGLSIQDFTNPHLVSSSQIVSKIGICVDPTLKNIHNAADSGVKVLISYHPWQGEAEPILRNQNLEIWPLHSAWDTTAEGVVYTFIRAVGVFDFYPKGEIVFGRIETTFRELIEQCQHVLGQSILPYTGDLKQTVKRIGVWAGPGFLPNYKKFWESCLEEECDTILSSELTLSALRYSQMHQLKLLDLGHSAMAKPGMYRLEQLLKELSIQDCPIQYFDDIYTGIYYTNCSFADQFTEVDDTFFTDT